MFERYADVSSAQKVYTDIKKSNEKNVIETNDYVSNILIRFTHNIGVNILNSPFSILN